MVRETMYKGMKVYVCEECGFGYEDKSQALLCEAFCKKMGACSTEITQQAVMQPVA